MDDTTFLRNILLNPEDDALRLVYADWLDERGDPRGELLRLLVHVFRRDADTPTPTTVKISRLIRNLGDAISKDWLASVSRGWIEFCHMKGNVNCPGRWERLASTNVPSIRRCEECGHDVWFCCTDTEEAKALQSRPSWHPIVKAATMKSE
jgi:uncharacterized protein (TIGR02996 family)